MRKVVKLAMLTLGLSAIAGCAPRQARFAPPAEHGTAASQDDAALQAWQARMVRPCSKPIGGRVVC